MSKAAIRKQLRETNEPLMTKKMELKDEGVNVDDALEKAYVPYNVFSFNQLDTIEAVQELEHDVRELFWEFVGIGENIIYANREQLPENNVLVAFLVLMNEFIARLADITSDFMRSGESVQKGTVGLYKGADGLLYWAGVPTNKYIDREGDIIADAAHREFVKSLKDGTTEYPDLYLWHIPVAVGKANWVDYDERGFLVAGGTVYKQYQGLVENLVNNSDSDAAMSHLVPAGKYERNAEGTITKYRSIEFSLLPSDNAANQLTAFTTKKAK